MQTRKTRGWRNFVVFPLVLDFYELIQNNGLVCQADAPSIGISMEANLGWGGCIPAAASERQSMPKNSKK